MIHSNEDGTTWCDCHPYWVKRCANPDCPVRRYWRDQEAAKDDAAMEGPPDDE